MSSLPDVDLLNAGLPSSPSAGNGTLPLRPRVEDVDRLSDRRSSYLQRNEARLFALSILRNPDYQEALLEAAKKRTLAPAIELAIMHYGWGKPTERVELGAPGAFSNDLSELSLSELSDRSREVALKVIELEYSSAEPEEQRRLLVAREALTDEALRSAPASNLNLIARLERREEQKKADEAAEVSGLDKLDYSQVTGGK